MKTTMFKWLSAFALVIGVSVGCNDSADKPDGGDEQKVDAPAEGGDSGEAGSGDKPAEGDSEGEGSGDKPSE